MANVLSDEKKQQVIALGRLGWTLRRIQQATGVRRETASAYLKAAGIAIRLPGGWGRRAVSKPAKGVITDFGLGKPAPEAPPDAAPQPPTLPLPGDFPAAKPANEVITDAGAQPAPAPAVPPTRAPSASACEPYRELIELGLARGRNAMAIWQDLVSESGFTSGYQSVRRFVGKLRGVQ